MSAGVPILGSHPIHQTAAADLAGPTGPRNARETAEQARIGREFEAIFLRKMLSALEKSSHVGQPGALASGGDIYSSMVVGALADAVAQAGGIGLGKVITGAMTAPAGANPPKGSAETSVVEGETSKLGTGPFHE